MIDGPIRVRVVADHALIREGARAFLGSVTDMEHVGEAADGLEAVTVAIASRPHVVIMDLHLPGVDGIAATRAICEAVPTAAVLVVSMLDDDTSVFAALRAGARGYVLKGAAPDELERAIRGVATGDAVFGPGIAERVLQTFTAPPAAAPAPFPELTDREREVLDHLAAGRSNGEIARQLVLSPRTVANHVSNILTKLHATDRTQAALRARDAGLGS
jgi:DNA-binding NarL/FixJ family response regulator